MLSMPTRESLAAEAFSYTARYDIAISRWFTEREGGDFPPLHVRAFEKVVDLPYGENPHQRAAYYQQVGARAARARRGPPAPRQAALLQQPARPRLGAQASSATSTAPACAIVKHNNPCGAASARTAAGGLPRGLRVRPGQRLRRRDRAEPPRRRASGRGDRRAVRRGALRPGLRRRCARDAARASRTCASCENEERRAAAARRARRRARSPAGCSCRTATASSSEREHDAGRHEPRARPSASGATCCSPGASASTCKSNAIVLARDGDSSASAPAR